MRKFLPLSVLAVTALLLGGGAASAQQKDTPAKTQGAGAECSRLTDSKKRDECVRQAQQKERAGKEMGKKSGAMKDAPKGKKK